MTKRGVGVDLSRLAPKAARAQVESTIGDRIRGWVVASGCTFTAAAEHLGVKRAELYEMMDHNRSFKLAWLELLPVALQLVILRAFAEPIGYELIPVAILEEGHSDDLAAVEIVHQATDVIRKVVETQADRTIDRAEAAEELKEIEELDKALALRRARLRQVLKHGAVRLARPYPTAGGEG